jgi:holo-[acyl-carrier protein] synthase
MIEGVGVDIVDVARIEAAIARHGRRFIERVFTKGEIRYCSSRPRPARHFAARFAAKEAVLKTLRTGWSGGVAWTEVEVAGDSAGAPEIVLHGRAREIAGRASLEEILISMSHTSTAAVAVAAARSKVNAPEAHKGQRSK